MIEFLTSPILYIVLTAIGVIAISRNWDREESRVLFRFVLGLAVAGNALMVGLTLA